MKKPIAIIAGEPNSISSEIIFKSWKLRKKYNYNPLLIIGSIDLLNLQKKKLKYNFKIKKINHNFSINDLKSNNLPVLNVNFNQKKPFEKLSNKTRKYIFSSFNAGLDLIKKKKVNGLINCPISKEKLFGYKNHGVTEFLSRKSKRIGKEVMLIYNKKLSVCPITTHIPISLVNKKIDTKQIVKKIVTINSFYKKIINRKPLIAVLGLNPHSFSALKKTEEKKIIEPAIKKIKKMRINVNGPISPDTAFIFNTKYKPDVIVGMYHDQVLSPFKTIFKFNAINITLGLPYIRISPDHGIGKNITGKNIANPSSLIEAIKFFNYIK
tara:strand:- start:227 stop:1198 length:972 start_codon:yes stop_codon:yes gene_type:complete